MSTSILTLALSGLFLLSTAATAHPATTTTNTAAAAPALSSSSACWSGGDIHAACDGFTQGCTSNGWLVKCDSETEDMVFADDCGSSNTTSEGNCACASNGVISCDT